MAGVGMTMTQQISPPGHEAMGHLTEASSEGRPPEPDGPPPEDDALPEDDAPPEDPPADEGLASSSLLFEDLLLLPQPAASARHSEPAATSEITRTFRPM